jgi:hypothetical protein
VSVNQLVAGVLLAATLVLVAAFYTWRQVRALRQLRRDPGPDPAEHAFRQAQAWRRLVGSGLLFVLAGLLAGALAFLEAPAQRLADERDAVRAAGSEPETTPEQRTFIRVYSAYWIVLLLVLLAVLVLGGLDLWATRAFALREHRKIQADRRAMIEDQVARLRHQRDGHRWN